MKCNENRCNGREIIKETLTKIYMKIYIVLIFIPEHRHIVRNLRVISRVGSEHVNFHKAFGCLTLELLFRPAADHLFDSVYCFR